MTVWLQTTLGRDHRSAGNNRRGSSSDLTAGMVIEMIKSCQQQEQINHRSGGERSQGDHRSGRMHVYMVGENMDDVSAEYSKVFFGVGAGVNCDIDKPLWEL